MKKIPLPKKALDNMPEMMRVDPPCESCGSSMFFLLAIDRWEDRVTIKCSGCGELVDTPIGQRMIVSVQ